MKGRTSTEIAAELKALKALVPAPGPHRFSVAKRIQLAIDELEGRGFDVTAGEFGELPDNYQDAIHHAREWLDGAETLPPSEGWGKLVETMKPAGKKRQK